MYGENEPDYSKLKYVLYARKSQTDETAQVRSIPDQILDCKKVQAYFGLNVVKILTEAKSAKTPRIRPVFKQVIDGIKKGMYDGILAWNPDRLARNMLEAGEIIDMVDRKIIKDLKFKTHTFTNDANGKMLLGMAFVLSKQYSDDLSQKITRGTRGNFTEGKSQTPKYGYMVSEDLRYSPDKEKMKNGRNNFELMYEAWQRRIKGEPIKPIAAYLHEQNCHRTTKKSGKKLYMTFQKLSDIFKDPFYFGKLLSKKTGGTVDLREIYDFEPTITEDEYNTVQKMNYRTINPTKQRVKFYPLRKMVICKYCHSFCRVGPSTGKTKKYLYFRCDNPDCKRLKKSIRGQIIFDFIYDYLKNGLGFEERHYKQYTEDLIKINEKEVVRLQGELYSKHAAYRSIKREITERSLNLGKMDNSSTAWKINNEKVEKLENERKNLKEGIEKLKEKIENAPKNKLTLEQFLNFAKNAANKVKSKNKMSKDRIARFIFLNFEVDEEKVTNYRVKEPFTTLIKTHKFLSGGDGGN